MDKRYVIAYLLAGCCIYFGVSMMIEGDAPAPDNMPAAGVVVEVDPELILGEGNAESIGGYMGTGRAQIKLVEAPEWPADQTAPRPVAEMDADRQYDGEARSEELQEVLRNLQGMDVYVEGVDGPLPGKKR